MLLIQWVYAEHFTETHIDSVNYCIELNQMKSAIDKKQQALI